MDWMRIDQWIWRLATWFLIFTAGVFFGFFWAMRAFEIPF